MSKTRLDLLLVARGLAPDQHLAQSLVMAGQVRIDGQVVLQPARAVLPDAQVSVDAGPPFVSRGGEKLAAALQAFNLSPAGLVCADVGASTGGFTDCLLQTGAAKVYAIDVGKGILDWKLRQDPRVVVLEGTNARSLDRLPEPVGLVTLDASFISLKVLLPVVCGWLPPSGGQVVALIKPQFEAGRQDVARGRGVIRDPAVHRQVLLDVLGYAQDSGCSIRGLLRSPLLGPKGNSEFLAWLSYPMGTSIAPAIGQREGHTNLPSPASGGGESRASLGRGKGSELHQPSTSYSLESLVDDVLATSPQPPDFA